MELYWQYLESMNKGLGISFISAGFPSPAEDFSQLSISLDKHLIYNKAATFMAHVNGNSMINSGINDGDILIIDRSLNARNGDIIIALLNGEFLVKELSIINNELFLIPKNSKYSPLKISREMDFEIWGVVTYSIHKLR